MPFGIVCAACLEDVPGVLHYLPGKAPDCVCDACKAALVSGAKTLEELGKPYWDRQRAHDEDCRNSIGEAETSELQEFYEVLMGYNASKHKGTPSDILAGRKRLQMEVGAKLLNRNTKGTK